MKTSSLVLFASAVCTSLVFAADNDPAARQLQVYPKNLARQHVGSNLFLYNPSNQTYVPTEASAAWLDDDVTTGWPVLAGKQHYLIALAEPELVSNFSVSAKAADGTVSLYAGDEPGAPGARSWTPLAQNIAFNSINEKKLDRPFTRFAKYILIETDLTNPGPLYSLYLYGEKPSTIYDLRQREQAIDARAIFGQVNDKTAFNVNGLYTGSTLVSANSPDGSLSWQKAIDDNPETGVAINGSTNDPGVVIKYGTTQSISRVALLTDSTAKGKLDFFAIDDAAPTTSLEGRTPTVSLVLDGSTNRSSIDFPAVPASKMAVRWTPVSPNDTVTIKELASFGTESLNTFEVGLKPEAVAAYDPGARSMGTGKDAKDPVAEGPNDPKDPAEVADFRGGSPYLPGALGFPPNINHRLVRFLSQQ
ncbi:MAG: hypothetical protein ABJF10_24285 [Chthoniobacter sp.]|uniref:hypothetical protein n=1 Tax=Chthoniobacter sp. TaxID=2510640 RepID=UPI0032A832E8